MIRVTVVSVLKDHKMNLSLVLAFCCLGFLFSQILSFLLKGYDF